MKTINLDACTAETLSTTAYAYVLTVENPQSAFVSLVSIKPLVADSQTNIEFSK
ncbi:MAG: hypothetical protein WDA42_01540 [Candidatus Bathyarchaeia archaeon]